MAATLAAPCRRAQFLRRPDQSAEILISRVVRTSTARAPAISTPVGPAPTRMKVSRSRWRLGIFFGLRLFKRLQDSCSGSPPHRRGFSVPAQTLQIRYDRNSCEWHLWRGSGNRRQRHSLAVSVADKDALSLFVHSGDFSQDHRGVLLIAKNAADRRRNLAGRQHCRCHLIKQGLKKMVVCAVDQDDLRGGMLREPWRRPVRQNLRRR